MSATSQVGRRSFLLGTAAAVAAGVDWSLTRSAHATGTSPRARRDDRPNVLWIITDDATRRTLATMPHTANLLVRPGVTFANAYAATPWCGPARASMLSGMYAHNHGAISNMTLPVFVAAGRDGDTVATRMADAGYVTGYFGKYMNGHAKEPEYVAPGWHRWVALVDADSEYNVDGAVRRIDTGKVLADAFSAKRCNQFIESQQGRPWFAVFAPTAPHDPYTPSAKHEHDFDHVAWDSPSVNEADLSDKAAFLQSLPEVDRRKMQRIWEGKLEELRDVDDQVRDLVHTLARTGQLANTVIMMISDNGYLLGEHRLFRKEQPYEESAGVPFVVRGPGFVSGVSTALVSQVDLMPTTLALAGLDPDAGRALDGRSMLANLRSGDWSDWRQRLMVENPKLGWAMLRKTDNTAFIDYYSRGEQELYDLTADPYQMNALPPEASPRAGDDLSRVTELRSSSGLSVRAGEM